MHWDLDVPAKLLGTLDFISCQVINRQTNMCVGGQIVKGTAHCRGSVLPTKMSCYSPERQRDGFVAQTAAVCTLNSKGSQLAMWRVGQGVLSHATLSSCYLIKVKFGLKSLEMTRVANVP